MRRQTHYTAHPTIHEFHQSNALIKAIIGPINSGSSSGSLMELFKAALQQDPDPYGLRHRVSFIGRGSYSQLNTTVRRTIKNWFPQMTLSGKSPITGVWEFIHPDKMTRVLWELVLHSIESADEFDEKSRSLEVSDFWLNEFKYLPFESVSYSLKRAGRWPPVISDPVTKEIIFGGCNNKRILMDSNMPDDESRWYKYFEVDHKHDPDVRLFIQPGALLYDNTGKLYENPEAENIENISGGYQYYWDVATSAGATVDEIKTDVCNMWGTSVSGLPVYGAEYFDDKHYSSTVIDPNPAYPLVLGVDWGVRYAGWVFAQYIDARLIVLDELLLTSMGTQTQLDDHVLPLLNMKYSGYRVIGWADKSGKARDDWEGKPLYMHVRQYTGIKLKLSRENRPSARIDAVKRLLNRPRGFIMSKGIRWLRRGFKGHYCFDEKKMNNRNPQPEKTKESHPHDGLQYIALNLNSSLLERDGDHAPVEDIDDLVII